jgi:alcohol dehydrogenase class IV
MEMMNDFQEAERLINEFKGNDYLYGSNSLNRLGKMTAQLGSTAVLVLDHFPGSKKYISTIRESLDAAGVQIFSEIGGAKPNAPREDLFRIAKELRSLKPDVVISFGGGSTIDVSKAAEVLRTLGGEIDDYFGTGLVTETLAVSGKSLSPHVAIQTAASSAAHLTKYSNITDINTGQKKLIVDDAIIPTKALFDYDVTVEAPTSLTADGALDGIAHSLEVLYGAVEKPNYRMVEEIASTGILLVVKHLPGVMDEPQGVLGRKALCLATDLGGYAIMVGGTNGGHLTSFSLVDLLSHGRACSIMNPYYTVFFAPAIEKPLRMVGKIYKENSFTNEDIDSLNGRDLGIAVAEAMISFSKRIGIPTTLCEVDGFSNDHIERALDAAKNPQLKMKLENMPVPLNAEMIDDYMGPILYAAREGDLSLIKNVN